jgi:serine/threonine-protein kinase
MMQKPPTLSVGYQLSQKRYAIVKKLGEGGYGSVYLARDTRLANREVAIKELHDVSSEAKKNFQHEAQLLASLNHPCLVSVSDSFSDGRSHYIVMDYIDGQDLFDVVVQADQNKRMLPLDKVVKWMIQVCEAVAYLHNRQPSIIHRDIKPQNIRLNKQEQAILVDFGIAKVDAAAKTRLIAKAVSQGFSPPEQYGAAGGTNESSDVYALGATLYCLLTVTLPPDGFDRFLNDKPLVKPSEINSKVTQPLEEVVLKAMSLNSLHRYQNGMELLQALQRAMGYPVSINESNIVAILPIKPVVSFTLHCGRCGRPLRTGARFCSSCGTLAEQQFCPSCRKPYRTTSRFCSFCGSDLKIFPSCPNCQTLLRVKARFCSRCRYSLDEVKPKADIYQAEQYLSKGNDYFDNEQFNQAATEYEKALNLGLQKSQLFIRFGRCYLELQDFDKAISVLEQGARLYSKEATIYIYLAQAYIKVQKLSQAIQTLEVVYQLDPSQEQVGILLAQHYFDIGRWKKAIPLLENLIQKRGSDLEIKHQLAICYLQNDQLVEAEKLIKQLKQLAPNSADSAFLMGLINLKKQDQTSALREFKQAIKLKTNHALAHYFMGEIYLSQQKWTDALAAYQASAKANIHDADAFARMAECFFQLEMFEEFKVALLHALQLDPNNKYALKIIAMIENAGG